jgi:hypothetical protein
MNLARNPWGGRLVAGVVSGSAATAAWHWRDENEAVAFETAEIPWVQELAAQPGMREMLVPGQMLRKHPVGQLLTEDDHLVSVLAFCAVVLIAQLSLWQSFTVCCAQLLQCAVRSWIVRLPYAATGGHMLLPLPLSCWARLIPV